MPPRGVKMRLQRRPRQANGQWHKEALRQSYEFDNLACFEAVTSLKALLQLFAAMKS